MDQRPRPSGDEFRAEKRGTARRLESGMFRRRGGVQLYANLGAMGVQSRLRKIYILRGFVMGLPAELAFRKLGPPRQRNCRCDPNEG